MPSRAARSRGCLFPTSRSGASHDHACARLRGRPFGRRHDGAESGGVNATDGGLRIVAFYEGNGPDDRGRSLDEILQFDDDALERVHDFIQWLFPMRERSGANPTAPRLDPAAIEAFRTRPQLHSALLRSLDRMLSFYGLAWAGDAIVRGSTFVKRSMWLTPGNHNHLRLTRILISLRVLGEEEAAQALFRCLIRSLRRSGAADELRYRRERFASGATPRGYRRLPTVPANRRCLHFSNELERETTEQTLYDRTIDEFGVLSVKSVYARISTKARRCRSTDPSQRRSHRFKLTSAA